MVIWETQEPGQMGTRVKRLSKGCCAELTDISMFYRTQGRELTLLP